MKAHTKEEGRTIRRIMSQTGLSESEVKSIPKYVEQLYQIKHPAESFRDKAIQLAKSLLRQATKEIKLAKEHPKVIERFKQLLLAYIEAGRKFIEIPRAWVNNPYQLVKVL